MRQITMKTSWLWKSEEKNIIININNNKKQKNNSNNVMIIKEAKYLNAEINGVGSRRNDDGGGVFRRVC